MRMAEARAEFGRQTLELAEATGRTVEHTRHIGEVLEREAKVLGDASERASSRVDAVGEALRARADELSAAAEQGSEQIAAVIERMTQHAGEAQHATRSTLEHDATLREALRGHVEALAEAAGRAVAEIETVGRELQGQSRSIGETTQVSSERIDTMVRSLARHGAQLGQTVEQATAQARAAAEVFRGQSGELLRASEEAARRGQELNENEARVRRRGFLLAANEILQDLGSLGVDMARVLAHPVPERAMRAYVQGDHGAVLRDFLGGSDVRSDSLIRRKYEQDRVFRGYVDRYLARFDELIAAADDVDTENMFSAVFLTSDTGKLYLLLSRALGRLS